jgi:hypothetical protein
MSGVDKEILSCIRKIKRRIHRNIILDYIVWGIILSLCCGSLVSMAALLFPLYKVHLIALKLLEAGAAAALLIGLTRIPKNSKAARTADSLGLKERVTTSMEFIGVEEGFAVIQKKDTLKRLKALDYKEGLTFSFKKKQLILVLIFSLIIIGSMLISTPAKSKAEIKYKFEIMQEQKLASIEKVEKDIKKNSVLSEDDRKELLDNLTALKQETKEAISVSDIDNSLTKFQIKMDSMKDKYKENDLNNLTNGLSRSETTTGLSQAIENGDKEAIRNEIKKLPEALKNATEEEQKKVAQNFESMAKNTEDEELKKSLSEMAQKLAENNPDKLKELAGSLDNLNNSVQKNIDNMMAKNELKGIQSDFMPEKPMDNKPSQGGSEPGSTNNPNDGSGQPGQGTQPGEGTAPEEGTKPEEEKTPEGGTNNNPGGEGSGTGGQKPGTGEGLNKPGSGNSTEGESVYVPSEGEAGGSGEVIMEGTLPPPTEPPKPQSLDKVIGKYKEKAYENMNSYVIPEAMKDIIKSYFSSLEQ